MRWTTFAALLAGCDLGRDDEGPHCEDTPSEVAIDEVTPLGFAASAVLARLPASEEPLLSWATGGSTELALGFAPGSTARFVRSEAVYPDSGTWPAIAVVCEDYVAVDVQVDLVTADGAFDEILDGELRAFDEDGGEIGEELDLAHLEGAFDLAEFTDVEDYDDARAWVTVTVGDGATTGVIEGQVSGSEPCSEGDTCTAWAQQVDVASWGTSDERLR